MKKSHFLKNIAGDSSHTGISKYSDPELYSILNDLQAF